MSHFVVWVDVENPALIDEIMEPFSENTENPDYLEFQNKEEEYRQAYETQTVDCIRMANGSLLTIYDSNFHRRYTIKDGAIYQKESGSIIMKRGRKRPKR